jgi:hypothetical protein
MRATVEKSGAARPVEKNGTISPARARLRAESSPRRGASPTKLRVSKPGDASELLAERAAERVLSAQPTDSATDAAVSPAVIPRTAVDSPAPVEAGEPFVPRGGGEPLPARVRDFFEPRFGRDLGDVRVHTDADAAEAAKSLGARGYAVGHHVVFGAGQFAPGTPAGDRLLAHELAHVVHGAHEPVVHRDSAGPLPVEVPEPDAEFSPDIKYPWQHPTLRENIYPFRDEELSFFLRTYREIDLDDPKVAATVKALSVEELEHERDKLATALKDARKAVEGFNKEYENAKKAKDAERARSSALEAGRFYVSKSRLEADLNYLPKPTKKGDLPSGAAKRWAAYWYSKYDDVGLELTHDALLARILDRFDADKNFERYPKWLRYMVVHVSGMRYRSAHGSYAPATDLVRRLKSEQVKSEVGAAPESEVARLEVQAAHEVESELGASDRKPRPGRAAALRARLAELRAVEAARAAAFSQKGQESQHAAFDELTKLEDERDRLTAELKDRPSDAAAQQRLGELGPLIEAAEAQLDSGALKRVRERASAAEKRRRAAVVEHELEKAAAALSTLNDMQAVAVLKAMRARKEFPEWVWREIVRVTALKLEIAPGEDWERVTPEEEAGKNQKGPVAARWRDIMGAWQKEITLWREKHGRDLSLVVIRAVCNEIAEMCLHARGVKPDGGINQKAQWYAGKSSGASFKRPKSVADLMPEGKPGASLFFLEWSYKPAGDPVAVVRSDTAGLLSDRDESLSDGFKGAGGWTYHFNADMTVTRTQPGFGPTTSPSTPLPTVTQYLNWLHEAQVVEVDANRGRVITFETGPTGLRAWRLINSLVGAWNVFVGFAPSGAEPADIDKYLKDILPGR